jgi:diguanylate cyclase (GGDEF)-like protein
MYDRRNLPEPAERITRPDGLAAKIASLLFRRSDGTSLARLQADLTQKDALIREQAAALLHSRKIFDRSSEVARIGVWECSLPDGTLTWTDVVYDIFDLPRGSAIDRERTLQLYSEASARELELRRSRAIEECSGFSMDAEIVTARGNRRWMRLTATVECEDGIPVRIFGMKQDITDEKLMLDRTRYLADFDIMTGLANRSQFQSNLQDFCDRPIEQDSLSALFLVDLDGFKVVNDTLGHAVGDDCLKETASRLMGVCHDAALISRIGGDEFAVLLGPGVDAAAVADLALAIVGNLGRPVDHFAGPVKLGASVGIALFDGSQASEIFSKADTALYAAKAAGRNTFRIFTPGHDLPDMKMQAPRSAA